jgi:hypothetical protein
MGSHRWCHFNARALRRTTVTMFRRLLGSDEPLVHDPGAKGPEGEGEACMTMLVLTYVAAIGILVYGAEPPPTSFLFLCQSPCSRAVAQLDNRFSRVEDR